MKTTNETKQDAVDRVRRAAAGCLVDASDTYIVALRAKLLCWVADLDAELAARDQDKVP
jgi:hypothetical protein